MFILWMCAFTCVNVDVKSKRMPLFRRFMCWAMACGKSTPPLTNKRSKLFFGDYLGFLASFAGLVFLWRRAPVFAVRSPHASKSCRSVSGAPSHFSRCCGSFLRVSQDFRSAIAAASVAVESVLIAADLLYNASHHGKNSSLLLSSMPIPLTSFFLVALMGLTMPWASFPIPFPLKHEMQKET